MAYCITPTILSVPVCPVVDEYFWSVLQKEMVGVSTLIMHCDLPSHLGIAKLRVGRLKGTVTINSVIYCA